jgi:gliding motility-associated-like protein
LSAANIFSPIATPTDTTVYVLTVKNGACDARDTVTVYVWKKPQASAGPDKYIVEGTYVTLDGDVKGTDVIYEWSPDYNIAATSQVKPEVSPLIETIYVLTVKSLHGCGTDVDETLVNVYKNLSIPNVFTPNGDGINDTWSILQLESYPDVRVTVCNRYGQQVFLSNGYGTEWDGSVNGQPVPAGTYYYVIDLRLSVPFRYSGWLEIIR